MLAAPAAATLAHGTTGTWLDEFVELGLPLIIFVILYFWSNRKKKAEGAAGEDRAKTAAGEDRARAAGEPR